MQATVPTSLRSGMMQLYHELLPGASDMKSLGRGFVCWPNVNTDIEQPMNECGACQSLHVALLEAGYLPWP
jgi:hypothetical protein